MDNTNVDKRLRDSLSVAPVGAPEGESLWKSTPSSSPRRRRSRRRNSPLCPAPIVSKHSQNLALSDQKVPLANSRAVKKKLKRLIIIQAAQEVFLEKRYRQITVDEIAKRAGVTKRTLYKYFPSKLALYVHMFDDFMQQLHTEISKTAGLDLPADKVILELFDTLYSFTKKNQKFMRLYWMVDSNEFDGLIPQELISRVNVWTRSMMRNALKVIRKGQMEGIIMDCDPALLIHLMSAINKGIFTHTYKERRFEIADIDPDILYNIFLTILSEGLFKASKEVCIESKRRGLKNE